MKQEPIIKVENLSKNCIVALKGLEYQTKIKSLNLNSYYLSKNYGRR